MKRDIEKAAKGTSSSQEPQSSQQPNSQNTPQAKGEQQPQSAVCEKFRTITAAHFIKHGETITYLDGKPLNTTDNGLVGLTYLAKQTVDKPEVIVNRLANDPTFRDAALNDRFPFRRQFDAAWKDFPRVYQWFIAARAGGSCPWGLSDAELNFVINWMGLKITTPNQEILVSGSIFNTIAVNQEIEKIYKSESQSRQKASFDASPEGKLKALRDKYTSMMAVQDCFDIRKNYVVKYIDQNVYNNARTAMKAYESRAKKEIPGLNTDKAWADASKEYAQSIYGVSLDANKKVPQNHTKDNQMYCNVMAADLIDSMPKEAPKRNF